MNPLNISKHCESYIMHMNQLGTNNKPYEHTTRKTQHEQKPYSSKIKQTWIWVKLKCITMILTHITTKPINNNNKNIIESTIPKSYQNPRYRESHKHVFERD